MARRAIEVIEHPLTRRNYRVATAAIESFVDLVERCLRVLIPGALVYARPRMGKTHAVDYFCLHLARSRPDVLTLRMSCEFHRTDFEGPFFCALLIAAGASGGGLESLQHRQAPGAHPPVSRTTRGTPRPYRRAFPR
jgi:hypothetical protein